MFVRNIALSSLQTEKSTTNFVISVPLQPIVIKGPNGGEMQDIKDVERLQTENWRRVHL
jgi:hypothetical protein